MNILRLGKSSYLNTHYFKQEILLFKKLGLNPVDLEETPQIVISNSQSRFEKLADHQRKSIKLIVHPNSGYDNLLNLKELEIDCPVILGNPIRLNAVLEYILSALFHHFTPLKHCYPWDEKRSWSRSLICGKSALIIGKGHIGRKLSEVLEVLGVKITWYDPYKEHTKIPKGPFDIISFCCSLNQKNKSFFGKSWLELLDKTGVLINSSRGQLIPIPDLKKHLKGSAFIDVFPKEPFQENLKQYNITQTSHIAGVWNEIAQTQFDFIEEILECFLNTTRDVFAKKYESLLLQNRKYKGEFI